MTDIIFHHYAGSPYAQKIKAFLGYKQLTWQSVNLSVILPRPSLAKLTGGNRRTPILQIGADIFCDSNLIIKVLDSLPSPIASTLRHDDTLSYCVSHWYEPRMFAHFSALRFQGPDDIIGVFNNRVDPVDFSQDRSVLVESFLETKNLSASITHCTSAVYEYASFLNAILSKSTAFLGGELPSQADFSAFHPLWWLKQGPQRHVFLTKLTKVWQWIERMEALGCGLIQETNDKHSLEAAASLEPCENYVVEENPLNLQRGDEVTITPDDYGLDGVSGTLLGYQSGEVILRRHSAELGSTNIHFPLWGYKLTV